MRLRVLTRFPKARENAAERKRSRSEADTGRRFGSSFGLEFGARASSAIRRIAVLGESDASAARGGRAEDEWAVLLRLYEPPGSAQPESERIGHCKTGRAPGSGRSELANIAGLPWGGVRPARFYEPQDSTQK